MLALSAKVWKSFEMIIYSPWSLLATKSKILCHIYIAKSAFLPVFRRIYSSPKYRGPEWRSLKIKLFELFIFPGFFHFFFCLSIALSLASSISPEDTVFGNSNCSYYLSISFFAFTIFYSIYSSSSPQQQVRQAQRNDLFFFSSSSNNFSVGILSSA